MQERGDTKEIINKRIKLIQNDIQDLTVYKELVNSSGKLFIINDNDTVSEDVIPWVSEFL
jgi:hypothetical protein